MNITTKRALDYFEAFCRLDGYQRAIDVGNRNQVIAESYDLSAKFKWNASKNKSLMRAIKERFEEERDAAKMRIRTLAAAYAPPKTEDKAELKAAFEAHQHEVERATIDEDKKLEALGSMINEVPNVLRLPADGLKIRARDPGIIGLLDILSDFIDGTPDFGDAKPAQ